MSHVGTVWAWKQRAGSAMAKLVLLQLADEGTKVGVVRHCSTESIARACECSTRSIQRHIDTLVASGLVELVRPGGRVNGRNVTARYRLRFEIDGAVDALLNDADLKALGRRRMQPIAPAEEDEIGGDTFSPPTESGVTACPIGGDSVSPPSPLGVTACPIGGDRESPIPSVIPGTTTAGEGAAAASVDKSPTPDTPSERIPIQIPAVPAEMDPATIAIDDASATRIVEELVAMFVDEGYPRPLFPSGTTIRILASWARGGLSVEHVRAELAKARQGAARPINSPIQYLATKIGTVRPKRRGAPPPGCTTPESIAVVRATVKAPPGASAEALAAAGVRPRRSTEDAGA